MNQKILDSAIAFALLLSISGSPLYADNQPEFLRPRPSPTATPTLDPAATPTPTPTPAACAAVDDCITQAISTNLASCLAASPACTPVVTEQFALSAETLARRVIDTHNCSARTTKKSCQRCFIKSTVGIDTRFDGVLFHGLLARAFELVAAEGKAVCSTRP